MKCLFTRVVAATLLFFSVPSVTRASHILGGRLTYALVSDSTYKITLTLYSNCGLESSSANSFLPNISPALCIMDSSSLVATKPLQFDSTVSGMELFSACVPPPVSQCQDMNALIPGVRRYLYSAIYTLPHRSGKWRFIHSGGIYSGFMNNIAYVSTLTSPSLPISNTIYYESRLRASQNSSPVITNGEQPYFCVNNAAAYTISATDPDGDSLYFALNPMYYNDYSGTSDLCQQYTVSGSYTYPVTPARPLVASMFSYNSNTGEMQFVPTLQQRAMIAYTIYEYRSGVLVGATQHNITLTVLNCSDVCSAGINDPEPDDVVLYPNPAQDELTVTFTRTNYTTAFVTDMAGRVLKEININNRQLSINTHGLAPGLYCLSLNGNNGTVVKRFTVAP